MTVYIFKNKLIWFFNIVLITTILNINFKHVKCDDLLKICDQVYKSINGSLEKCFSELGNENIYLQSSLGVVYRTVKKEQSFSTKILIYQKTNNYDMKNLFSGESSFGKCLSKTYVSNMKNIDIRPGIGVSTTFQYSSLKPPENDLKELEERDQNGNLSLIRRSFTFNVKDIPKKVFDNTIQENRNQYFAKSGRSNEIITGNTINSVNTSLNVDINTFGFSNVSDPTITTTITKTTITRTTTATTTSITTSIANIINTTIINNVNSIKRMNSTDFIRDKYIESDNFELNNEIISSNKKLESLCQELSSEELIDAIRIQNTFFFPDIVYLKVAILLRRLVKRMDISRSAEESLSMIMPGIGGLVVSDVHCEETMRVSLVSGELLFPGISHNDFAILCERLQQCLTERLFHDSTIVSLSKSKRYVEFALKRNRNFMWEVLNKMTGVLGNNNGLRSYQLWLELEILIKLTNNDEDVLHSDLPKEIITVMELIKDSKSPTVECTISLMRIGAPYDIRLSQISEVAKICNRIISDSSNFLSAEEMRLISDTTILSRIADWMIGTFILEKHIPSGVTKPAACMYLAAITSPMDYSTLTNFLWPRVVFALASSSSSALSFTSRSVDPENCRKALLKILKVIGDKLQINIDETCGKMAGCILNGRLGRISVDETINNALSQSKQILNYDFGTNSASLRLARFIFESKAPRKSRRNGFSKLSAPLRASVLYGHLQMIMPGGFNINDIVKFVHLFTKETPPNGPVKKCFKVLIKYIPVFVANDTELKNICINAFGPWIMPDILVSDVSFSQNSRSSDFTV